MDKTKPLQIREAVRADKSVIAEIYAVCFEETWAVAAVDDLLQAKGCWAFILEINKGPKDKLAVGFVLARSVLDEAEILSFGVDPAFQGRGYGKKLMQDAISAAKHRGAVTVFLEVSEDNHLAQILYRNCGFEVIGRRKAYYLKADGSRVDALNLSLKIT